MQSFVITKKDQSFTYYTKWCSLNFSITLQTVFKSLGLGKVRAQRLFDEIISEMRRYDERDNYNESLAEIQAYFRELGIPFDCQAHDKLISIDEQKRIDRRRDQNRKQVSMAEAAKMQETLQAMQNLMKTESGLNITNTKCE